MKFRKKPVVIDAFEFQWGVWPDWFNDAVNKGAVDIVGTCIDPSICDVYHAKITTLEGVMIANKGDWVIKGVKGEIYPCKPDIFEATYERVEE